METTLTPPDETTPPVTAERPLDAMTDPLAEQTQAPAEGGIRVSTASMSGQWSFDEQYSRELALWMQSMPGQDLQQSLDHMVGMSFHAGKHTQSTTDQTLKPMRADGSGDSLGVLIGNAHYEHLADLRAPITETRALAGQLSGRGFESTVLTDQSAAQMLAAYTAPLSDPRLSERDEVMLYFSGHGTERGVLGVDSKPPKQAVEASSDEHQAGDTDLVSASTMLGIARKISAKGADVSLVLDCCHSGGMNQKIGSGTKEEAVEKAVSCLDVEGATRLQEALRPFHRMFFRFTQTSEQKAMVAAATAATDAAIDANGDLLDESREACRPLEERLEAGGGSLTDGLTLALLQQRQEELLAERSRLLDQKREETAAVITGWWVAGYPALLEVLSVFQAETGESLAAPLASPQSAAELDSARKQLYTILDALDTQLRRLEK